MATQRVIVVDQSGQVISDTQEPMADEAANRDAIEAQVVTALGMLQTIIDTAQVSFTTVAQSQTAMRALQSQVKDLARVQRRLLRYTFNRTSDGAD